MAQDTTPSIIMYQGGTNTFPVPFDKGYYGEVKVLFVRRGATGYEYEPASSNYVVNGRLYAWGTGSDYIYTHTPTPAVGAPIYNDQDADSGKQVEATAGQTITVEGVSYIRATQHDISNHLILTWNGEELTMDDYICIGRDTERGQPYSLPNNQKHIEGALDNIERQVQELKDKTDNALVVDPTHTIDANKMGPIDWLETIVRSTDKTARAIRYHNGYLQFSLEDPDVPLDQKTWTSILNTINVTTIREWYDEEKNEYRLQYSKDNGVSWKELPLNFSSIPGLEERLATIESEQVVLSSGVAANTSAVQRNQIDINTNTVSISSLRLDMNAADAVLRESINANADKISSKQDKLNAGDNIIISGNVISATGGGAGLDFIVVQELPETGQKGAVYLMAKDGEAPDVYDEYVWITATETFELIGSTKVDLSGYLPLSGGTMSGGLTLPELTVSTAEGTFTVSVVAGVVTIATNNGLDIASPVKFDHAPTTDDNTTWANALDTSLVRKAQVASALSEISKNSSNLDVSAVQIDKQYTIGGAEEISTSESWISQNSQLTQRQRACCYGDGYYIVAGTGGDFTVSKDGVNWERITPFTNQVITSVAYGRGRFIAVDSSGGLFTATDLFGNWEKANIEHDNILESIVYANGKFIAVYDGGAVALSTDVKNWEIIDTGTQKNLYAVTAGQGKFIAVGQEGTILISVDGQAWLDKTSPEITQDLRAVTFGGGLFIAGGKDGVMIYSKDGENWAVGSSNSSSTVSYIRGISYLEKKFYAVMYINTGAGEIWTSTNGINWTTQQSTTGRLWCVSKSDDIVFASGDGGAIYTLSLGLTWQNDIPEGENVWERIIVSLNDGTDIKTDGNKVVSSGTTITLKEYDE